MKWDDLTEKQQREIQNGKTEYAKKLRKKLFWNDKWVDAYGNEHYPRAQKGVITPERKEE